MAKDRLVHSEQLNLIFLSSKRYLTINREFQALLIVFMSLTGGKYNTHPQEAIYLIFSLFYPIEKSPYEIPHP